MTDFQSTSAEASGETSSARGAGSAGTLNPGEPQTVENNGAGAWSESQERAGAEYQARPKHERRKKRASGGRPRSNLYDDVTAKITRELEAGRFPWAQPWANRGEAATIAAGLPKNASTGRAYSGINILLLWGAAIENGFSDQVWLTFKQAKALGGSVRRGERGSMVVYADKFVPKEEQQRVEKEGGDASFVPFLKRLHRL